MPKMLDIVQGFYTGTNIDEGGIEELEVTIRGLEIGEGNEELPGDKQINCLFLSCPFVY